jgi:hypothetical protein
VVPAVVVAGTLEPGRVDPVPAGELEHAEAVVPVAAEASKPPARRMN